MCRQVSLFTASHAGMFSFSSTLPGVSVVEWEEEFLAELGEGEVPPTEHLLRRISQMNWNLSFTAAHPKN